MREIEGVKLNDPCPICESRQCCYVLHWKEQIQSLTAQILTLRAALEKIAKESCGCWEPCKCRSFIHEKFAKDILTQTPSSDLMDAK